MRSRPVLVGSCNRSFKGWAPLAGAFCLACIGRGKLREGYYLCEAAKKVSHLVQGHTQELNRCEMGFTPQMVHPDRWVVFRYRNQHMDVPTNQPKQVSKVSFLGSLLGNHLVQGFDATCFGQLSRLVHLRVRQEMSWRAALSLASAPLH